MGQSDGYTPLWLRELVMEAGSSQGVAIHQLESVGEFVERAVEVSHEDQGPLLLAGIPALNLETESADYAATRALTLYNFYFYALTRKLQERALNL
jgi:hypothetical protein